MVRRHLFNALCVLSTVMLGASAALWVRGQWAQDLVWMPPVAPPTQAGFVTGDQSVTLMWGLDFRSPYGWRSYAVEDVDVYNPYGSDFTPNLVVMSYGSASGGGTLGFVSVPYWALLCASLVLPGVWCLQQVRVVRAGSTACYACGYDLRGGAGPACPECGAARRVRTTD